MSFAGDIQVGSKVRFMKANFSKLTYAAAVATHYSNIGKTQMPIYSFLISCVGRKLILGDCIHEIVML